LRACQLDAWAQAHALLDYDRQESSQAWYQVEWTLSSAGVTDSVLVNDATLDPTQQHRVTAWLDTAARKDISFEKPGDSDNNHHYWRALAATAIGVTASDDMLYRFGIQAYVQAIAEIDRSGAFPKEMARHENATHYQGFALQPLVLIAEFVTRQGIGIYATRQTAIPCAMLSSFSAVPSTIPASSSPTPPMPNPATLVKATSRISPFTRRDWR